MAIGAGTLLLTAITSNYVALTVIRAIGGYATAVVFIVGAALASRIPVTSPTQTPRMVSVYMSGVGLGIVLSGLVVPWSLARWGDQGWRGGWFILGLLGVVCVPAALYGARQCRSATGASTKSRNTTRLFAPTFAWYVLFGAGYVTYMTFIAAFLHQQGASSAVVAGFFITLGAACMVGTLFLWGWLIHRLSSRMAPAAVSVTVALGILPVLVSPGVFGAFVSAVLFGLSFMAGPAVVTVIVQRTLPPPRWTASIATLTVAFSLGQALGPVVSGMIADSGWGIAGGLWSSLAVLLVASIGVTLCRSPSGRLATKQVRGGTAIGGLRGRR
jgi:predicted MFS family arabinose efflux permease